VRGTQELSQHIASLAFCNNDFFPLNTTELPPRRSKVTPMSRFGFTNFGVTRAGHWDAELCTRCSQALKSANAGVLYHSQQSIERAPKTCPLCAINEFLCSIYLTSFDKVEFELEKFPDIHPQLVLTYHFGDDMEIKMLSLIPVKCKR
jgi:hypothetical protein